MLKSILMATDLSQRSDRALHRAVALARQSGAKLTILTVVDDEQPDDMREDQVNHAHRQLNASREALCQGIECTVLVEQGDPTDLVLTHARNDDPDLMVLGPHRERNLWDMLYETTGQRIARMTHVAVLLVVEPAETKYNSVLLATDFSPASTAAALLANEVAPEADLQALHALHVPYGSMGRASGGGQTIVLRPASARMRKPQMPIGAVVLKPQPTYQTLIFRPDRQRRCLTRSYSPNMCR